jgi:hypothetical protein
MWITSRKRPQSDRLPHGRYFRIREEKTPAVSQGFAEYRWTGNSEGIRKLNKRMAPQVGLESA